MIETSNALRAVAKNILVADCEIRNFSNFIFFLIWKILFLSTILIGLYFTLFSEEIDVYYMLIQAKMDYLYARKRIII